MFNHPALIELHAQARVMELRESADKVPSRLLQGLRQLPSAVRRGHRPAPSPALSRPRSEP